MSTLLAVLEFTTSRRLFQTGIVLCGFGAIFVGLGAVGMLLRPRLLAAGAPPAAEPVAGGAVVRRRGFARVVDVVVNPALVAAALFLLVGFILVFISVHWGVSPFSPRLGAAA